MAIETTEAQLERVQAAIKAVEENSQEYWYNGMRLTRADLATLYKRENELQARLAAEKGENRTYAAWPGWMP